MILSFQKQMTNHWVKVAKIIKDLIAKKAGGHALFNFIDFLLNINLPISLIILPILHNKVFSIFFYLKIYTFFSSINAH